MYKDNKIHYNNKNYNFQYKKYPIGCKYRSFTMYI